MEISGRTKMICLLGSPVAHSMSPAMHNEAFAELGLDYRYLAFDVKEGERHPHSHGQLPEDGRARLQPHDAAEDGGRRAL